MFAKGSITFQTTQDSHKNEDKYSASSVLLQNLFKIEDFKLEMQNYPLLYEERFIMVCDSSQVGLVN